MQEALDILLPYMNDTRQIHFENAEFFKALHSAKDNMFAYDKIG